MTPVLSRLLGAMNTILMNIGLYRHSIVSFYEDDSKIGLWYVMLEQAQTKFPTQYVNHHTGKISANFLMDQAMGTGHVQALFTISPNDDIVMHWSSTQADALKLPNIATSSGIKYDITEIEKAVGSFCGVNTMASAPITAQADPPVRALPRGSRCDCGGHKCGYSDTELHGHASWCKLNEKTDYTGDGCGD